jgi:hypothetical protein
MILRNARSNSLGSSDAPISRAASMKRSRCGFSSGDGGLRAGMANSYLELSDPVIGLCARRACPLFVPPLLPGLSHRSTAPFHTHVTLATIRASIRRLFAQSFFQHCNSGFQCCDFPRDDRPPLCECSNLPSYRNYMGNQRPFSERHHV